MTEGRGKTILRQLNTADQSVLAVGPVHLYCTGTTFCPHRLKYSGACIIYLQYYVMNGHSQRLLQGYRLEKVFLFTVVYWPNSEFYGAFFCNCILRYFCQSHSLHPFLHATIKLTHVFMVSGWWVTVDFDSQCKILCFETKAHIKKNNFKNKNLPNYSHPYQTDACWDG